MFPYKMYTLLLSRGEKWRSAPLDWCTLVCCTFTGVPKFLHLKIMHLFESKSCISLRVRFRTLSLLRCGNKHRWILVVSCLWKTTTLNHGSFVQKEINHFGSDFWIIRNIIFSSQKYTSVIYMRNSHNIMHFRCC